jgi:hypothetical protein
MASAYKMSIHAGTSATVVSATIPWAFGGSGFLSSYIQYNVWDNAVYVEWQTSAGTFTADVELDPNWQPIIIPVSVLGFRIRSKAAGMHGRYQIIGMG